MLLGHADDHKLIPTDPVENVRWRIKLIRACETDLALREGIRTICKRDILFFINAFCWFHNPLKSGSKVGPFILWPYQEEVILQTLRRWVIQGKDYLWEKSREMGATWLALIIVDWLCLFHDWEQCMAVSHSLVAVDNGRADPNTLFWKIRHLHEHMPDWITQGVEDSGNKKSPVIRYPKTNGSLAGYASTGRSGVGGRGKVMLDELGKQDRAHEIVGNTADVGPRLFISTHYGIGTEFYSLCQRSDLPKSVMHWSMHPDKNKGLYRWNPEKQDIEFLCSKTLQTIPRDRSDYPFPPDYPFILDGSPTGGPFPGLRSPWYDEECVRRQDKRQVAMHLDIDAQGSDSQFFDAIVLRQLRLAYCESPKWEGELEHTDKGIPVRLIQQPGGRIKLWWHPDGHGKFPLGKYACGIDISSGVGTTNTVLTIADTKTGHKILEFADPYMSGEKFGPLAVALCRLFPGENIDGAFMVWEKQGGAAFTRGLLETSFRRFYFQKNRVHESLRVKVTDRPGWESNPKSKKLLLIEYRHALQTRRFVNRSTLALEECAKFRWNLEGLVEHAQEATTNDPTGARENHGDRTIADALAWFAMTELGVPTSESELQKPVVIGGWEWRRMMALEQDRRHEDDAA